MTAAAHAFQHLFYSSTGEYTGHECSTSNNLDLVSQWQEFYNQYNQPEWEPTEWASSQFRITAPTLPSGVTVVGGLITIGSSPIEPEPGWSGQSLYPSSQCGYPGNTGTIAGANGYWDNTTSYAFDIAQGLQQDGWGYIGVQPLNANDSGSDDISSLYESTQYAYTPTGIGASQVYSGNGTQNTISWDANGNQSDISYILKRETLQGGSVTQGWTTIYQGTATSFTTGDQTCGFGYVYSVAAYGQQGTSVTTPWDQSGEVDEYPCSVSVAGASSTSVTVSWPQVTSATVPVIVWCEEDTPAGGVSCSQANFTLGAGDTSATITGLTPNAEYAVWACSQTHSWGCPDVNVWTYAAPPALAAYDDPSGISYNAQPLTWSANGNAPGTVYVLQQGTYAASGSWQGGTVLHQGTGASFVATQNAGTSYAYTVWALNAGYGNSATPGSNAVPVQVASTPTLSVTGPTTATVSWSTVAYMSTTGVRCEVAGSNAWGPATLVTGGGTSFHVTGLAPNTQYACATYAASSNQGIPWWQGSPDAWTDPAAPVALTASTDQAGVPWGDQPLSWGSGGNPAGITYALLQNGNQVYSGTGTTFTAMQTIGGSYTYTVYAIGGGGARSAASGSIVSQVASAPTLTTTGATTATVSWPAVGGMTEVAVTCGQVGSSSWKSEGTVSGGATSLSISGMLPATHYQCDTEATASNQGIQWPVYSNEAYTHANPPTGAALSSLTQTAATVSWGANGNPGGTEYGVALYTCANTSSPVAQQSTTSLTATFTALIPGTCYLGEVAARNGTGTATAEDQTAQAYTVPDSPTSLTGADGGLGWSATAGRGYVTLSWPAVPGATGYEVWVYDGSQYEGFPVSGNTWDSRVALIYPPDSALYPNVGEGSKTPPVFSHNAGGLNLRDQPLDLYCTTGTAYCTANPAQNYWFSVSALDASGNSATFQLPGTSAPSGDYYEPTLPLQTDPNAPTIAALSAGNANGYAYGPHVTVSLLAAESPSGIAAYALSNNGTSWTTTAVSGCTVGQVAACGASLDGSASWTLTPGPGTKTIYAKVESAAGVWSAIASTTVYVETDQTPPTVNLTLDGGQASTNSTTVTAATQLTDPLAQQAGLSFQARTSTNGGQTWSAWQAEGAAMSWSATLSIPGGASGERTVLEQVEDSDLNVGQGAATIYYVNPTPVTVIGGGGSGGTTATPFPCTWQANGHSVPATCVTVSQVAVPLHPPSGATEMRVSLDDVTWGPWLAAASSVPLDLGASPGAKTVWVQFRNAQGTVEAQAPAYYVYDPAPPTLQASWVGNASATDSAGNATLQLQASDDVGQPGNLAVTVTENGARLYAGAYQNTIPLTLNGSGYQLVQVTVTDLGGNTTTETLGIYVE